MTRIQKTSVSVFFILATFLFAEQALAHATPITYEPGAASILETTPSKISIRFSERIEPAASGISIFIPDGTKIITIPRVDPSDAHIFETTFPADTTAQGTYTISWQVVSSDDGHFTKGAFSFSIGKTSTVGGMATGGQIQIQHITTVPQSVMIGIELVGQALLVGVLFLITFVLRPLRRSKLWENTLFSTRKTVSLILIGTTLIVAGCIAFIVIKTFDLEQLQGTEFSPTLRVFLSTVDGRFALYRAILACLFAGVFLKKRRGIFSSEKFTKVEVALLSLFILIIINRSRVSHAAASHFLPNFSIFMNAVHLFFKEIWIGGVLAFSALFLPIYRKSKSLGAYACSLFSMHTSLVVAAVSATGCYIVWLHLKDPAYIFTSQWGSTFIVLTLFAIVLAGLRFYHQLIADYANKTASTLGKVTSALMDTTILLEAFVGITVLFVTSAIIITTPPYPPEHFAFEKTAISVGAKVSLVVSPISPERDFLVSVIDEKTGKEIPLTKTVITMTNSEKSIGPIVADITSLSPGTVSFPRALLAPPGTWDIHITGQRTGSYDAIGTFTVNYPDDIENSRVSGDARKFGSFESILVAIAIAAIVFAWFVFKWSKKIVSSYTSLSTKIPDARKQLPFPLEKIIAIGACIVLIFIVSFIHTNYLTTPFEKLCKSNGHFWLQSVPVFDGVALSSDTTTGCFLDVGMYHFGDMKSYTNFYKPLEAAAELHMPDRVIVGAPVQFTITLNTSENGETPTPAREIGTYHDRILHIIAVDERFETFAHFHPEDIAPISQESRDKATFTLRHTFEVAGRHALNVNYVVQGKEKASLFIVDIAPGKFIRNSADALPNAATDVQEFSGYKITLKHGNIKSGERTKLYYHIEKDGAEVRDLEPYLAAAMHIAIVKEDLTRFTHTHGEALLPGSVWFQQLFGKYKKYHTHFAPEKFGPNIITAPWTTIFPTPGRYHVFGEFKHAGKIVVTHFVVNVD